MSCKPKGKAGSSDSLSATQVGVVSFRTDTSILLQIHCSNKKYFTIKLRDYSQVKNKIEISVQRDKK